MPYRFVNLRTGEVSGPESNPAEVGTLIPEFGTLSRLTGNRVYSIFYLLCTREARQAN
jgi:hypothetical protein